MQHGNGAATDASRRGLLVDDHPMVRRGLVAILKQLHRSIQILEAATVATALGHLAAAQGMHLILYDWNLPQGGGMDGLRALQRQAPRVPVLVMSGNDEQAYRIAAASVGAEFLAKSEEAELVRQTLERLLAHPPAPGGQTGTAPAPRLTQRQGEVLQLLARGWPNKRIARQLNVSDKTITAHVTDIMRLLEVENRTEAVLAASRLGLIDLPRSSGGAA